MTVFLYVCDLHVRIFSVDASPINVAYERRVLFKIRSDTYAFGKYPRSSSILDTAVHGAPRSIDFGSDVSWALALGSYILIAPRLSEAENGLCKNGLGHTVSAHTVLTALQPRLHSLPGESFV